MNFKSFFQQIYLLIKSKLSQPKKPFVYVAIGDSTIEGLGASHPDKNFTSLIFSFIKKDLIEAQYHNLGQAGARVEDVLKHQINQAIDLQPDLVILSVGSNDAIQKRRLSTFEAEYNLLLERLKETKAIIVVNNIPDLTLAPVMPKLYKPIMFIQVYRFNNVIKKLVKNKGYKLVDLYSQSRKLRGQKELISEDGFHPNDAGYALWADFITQILRPNLIR